ncbi:MAG TPA: hypothetical protein VJ301_03395 [Propionibacteriaceae bacterium]|nr:hypothetical protein [Propionibacteriaceae bacterium]
MADTQMPMANTRPVSPMAHGIAAFAGVIMIVAGAFQAIEGLAGIVNDQYLVVLPNYFLAFDLTLWGWLHLLVGLALLAIGIFVLRGATWARVAGMIIAGISALLNFIWLPYSPWWSLLVIGIDILVIWALANYHRESAPQGTRAAVS